MPCLSTIFYWRRHVARFEEQVQLGMRIRAERFCNLGWELASAAMPDPAYLTHVRLTHLRWTAGVTAPKVFRIRTVEPEQPPREIKVLMRTFRRRWLAAKQRDGGGFQLRRAAWAATPSTTLQVVPLPLEGRNWET